jgi:hypothetical protein
VRMDEALKTARPYCPAATMDAEDPLFLLYTSGSTGKPKVRRRSRCWRPAQALKARCAAFLFWRPWDGRRRRYTCCTYDRRLGHRWRVLPPVRRHTSDKPSLNLTAIAGCGAHQRGLPPVRDAHDQVRLRHPVRVLLEQSVSRPLAPSEWRRSPELLWSSALSSAEPPMPRRASGGFTGSDRCFDRFLCALVSCPSCRSIAPCPRHCACLVPSVCSPCAPTQPRRCLRVRRGLRLDHRPLVHPVWPARQRHHDAHV